MAERGRFIVIEGLDGSGKTTQMHRLADWLRSLGRNAVETAEPTTAGTGGLVRDALSGFTPRTGAEIAALFVSDRIAHNVDPIRGINRLLAEGTDVICDRYYYSSLAYQGSVTDFEWVYHMNIDCPEIRQPDICLFLDLDYAACLRRMETGRAFKEIYENEESLNAVREKYRVAFRRLEGRDNIKIINAGRDVDSVAADMISAVSEIL